MTAYKKLNFHNIEIMSNKHKLLVESDSDGSFYKWKSKGRLIYIFQLCNFPLTAKEEGFEKSAIALSLSLCFCFVLCSPSLGCSHLYIAKPHVTRRSTEIKDTEMKQ